MQTMQTMTPEETKKQKYAKKFLAKLDSSPDELTKFERRLGANLRKARDQTNQLMQDVNGLRDQIEQGKARLRSLELQLESAGGKANGILETIVEIHFVDEAGEEVKKPDTPEVEPVKVQMVVEPLEPDEAKGRGEEKPNRSTA